MFRLFLEGGASFMSILTILLILILLAAWKAPAWLKELGALAMATGVFSIVLGLRQMFDAIQGAEFEISFPVMCGGLKVAMIPLLYSIIIYGISLILRIIRKPRI